MHVLRITALPCDFGTPHTVPLQTANQYPTSKLLLRRIHAKSYEPPKRAKLRRSVPKLDLVSGGTHGAPHTLPRVGELRPQRWEVLLNWTHVHQA